MRNDFNFIKAFEDKQGRNDKLGLGLWEMIT